MLKKKMLQIGLWLLSTLILISASPPITQSAETAAADTKWTEQITQRKLDDDLGVLNRILTFINDPSTTYQQLCLELGQPYLFERQGALRWQSRPKNLGFDIIRTDLTLSSPTLGHELRVAVENENIIAAKYRVSVTNGTDPRIIKILRQKFIEQTDYRGVNQFTLTIEPRWNLITRFKTFQLYFSQTPGAVFQDRDQVAAKWFISPLSDLKFYFPHNSRLGIENLHVEFPNLLGNNDIRKARYFIQSLNPEVRLQAATLLLKLKHTTSLTTESDHAALESLMLNDGVIYEQSGCLGENKPLGQAICDRFGRIPCPITEAQDKVDLPTAFSYLHSRNTANRFRALQVLVDQDIALDNYFAEVLDLLADSNPFLRTTGYQLLSRISKYPNLTLPILLAGTNDNFQFTRAAVGASIASGSSLAELRWQGLEQLVCDPSDYVKSVAKESLPNLIANDKRYYTPKEYTCSSVSTPPNQTVKFGQTKCETFLDAIHYALEILYREATTVEKTSIARVLSRRFGDSSANCK